MNLRDALKDIVNKDVIVSKLCIVRSVTTSNFTCDVEPTDYVGFDITTANPDNIIYSVRYSASSTESSFTPAVGSNVIVLFIDNNNGFVITASGVTDTTKTTSDGIKVKETVEVKDDGTIDVAYEVISSINNTVSFPTGKGTTTINGDSILNSNFDNYHFKTANRDIIKFGGVENLMEILANPNGKITIGKTKFTEVNEFEDDIKIMKKEKLNNPDYVSAYKFLFNHLRLLLLAVYPDLKSGAELKDLVSQVRKNAIDSIARYEKVERFGGGGTPGMADDEKWFENLKPNQLAEWKLIVSYTDAQLEAVVLGRTKVVKTSERLVNIVDPSFNRAATSSYAYLITRTTNFYKANKLTLLGNAEDLAKYIKIVFEDLKSIADNASPENCTPETLDSFLSFKDLILSSIKDTNPTYSDFVNIFAFGFSNSPSFIYYIDAAIEYLGVVINEKKWYSKQPFSVGGYKKINEVFDSIETRLKNSSCDAMSKFIKREGEITKKTIETQITLGEVLNDIKAIMSATQSVMIQDMAKIQAALAIVTPGVTLSYPLTTVTLGTEVLTLDAAIDKVKEKVDSFLN